MGKATGVAIGPRRTNTKCGYRNHRFIVRKVAGQVLRKRAVGHGADDDLRDWFFQVLDAVAGPLAAKRLGISLARRFAARVVGPGLRRRRFLYRALLIRLTMVLAAGASVSVCGG